MTDPLDPRAVAGTIDLEALAALRHDLHAHPELRFEEHRTAGIVASRLADLGWDVHRGLGGTGVVATLRGASSRAIILRADMDALPIVERSGVPYASRTNGKMHACGHDGHTAMLLGAAEVIARRPRLPGTIHLVFQPGEEGGAGALRMIEDGLFDMFPSEACFGLHNWPAMPQGRFGICAGPIMAAGTRFSVTVRGRGGHAAQPHLTVDPLPIGCALVGQLQALISRRTNPVAAAVLSVCMFDAGVSDNVIADEATFRGTIRTLDQSVMDDLCRQLRSLSDGFCRAHDAEANVAFYQPYPLTANSPPEASFAAAVMEGLVGAAAVDNPTPPNMTSEDFGFMLQRKPGAYALVGAAIEGKVAAGLHAPTYDFNDAVMPLGIAYWSAVAARWWSGPTPDQHGVPNSVVSG